MELLLSTYSYFNLRLSAFSRERKSDSNAELCTRDPSGNITMQLLWSHEIPFQFAGNSTIGRSTVDTLQDACLLSKMEN